jgi:Ca2+-binding EF-hand superfamily protein
MRSKTIVATVVGLGIAAAFAGQGFAGQGVEKADTDNNGEVSLSEFKAAHELRLEEHFAHMDTNADGVLSNEEMQAAPRGRKGKEGQRRHRRERNPEQLVERLDKDGSGGLSLQELEGKRFSPDSQAFYAADSDGNGELSGAELHEMMKAHHAERRAQKDAAKSAPKTGT